nr:MAG TPA: hypothetical protein [Caudoviricetes sp.]
MWYLTTYKDAKAWKRAIKPLSTRLGVLINMW